MSFIGTAKKVINILDWFTEKYENVKKFFKKWNRRRIAASVRTAINNNDKSAVARRVRSIIKKRQKRTDSN